MKDKFGRVDILIDGGGAILRAAAEEVALADWEQVLQVNLTSVFQLSQLAARDMIPRGGIGTDTAARSSISLRCLVSREASVFRLTRPVKAELHS